VHNTFGMYSNPNLFYATSKLGHIMIPDQAKNPGAQTWNRIPLWAK